MLKGKGLLTPLQKDVLALFAQLPDQDQFYLTGGTALAEYYLGHRLSFDLDLFTSQSGLIQPMSYQFEQHCATHGLQVTVTRRFASYAEFVIAQGEASVKVDLALDSPFRFESPVASEHGVLINDYEDIKVDKLLAYYGRAEPRDAVDLYWLLQHQHEPVQPLLERAEKKDPGFDLYWFAIALNRSASFPDEPERWPVTMLGPWEPKQIKDDFQRLALALMDQITRK